MPYHTDHREEILLHDRVVSAIAVYADERLKLPTVGVAHPKGWVWIGRAKARVFELRLKGDEGPLDELWIVRGGVFSRVGDGAEVMG